MKIIDQKTRNAVINRNNFMSSNTGIFIESAGNPYGVRAEVYLHGHLIAEVWHQDTATYRYDEGPSPMKPDAFIDGHPVLVERSTLKDYPTNTTKSRLKALGVDVYTKAGVTYIGDEVV